VERLYTTTVTVRCDMPDPQRLHQRRRDKGMVRLPAMRRWEKLRAAYAQRERSDKRNAIALVVSDR